MSGERLISEQHPTKAGKMVFRFRQEIPIPSYLVALVVGALESRWRLALLSPRGAEVKVKVQYETSPSCTAVQWLKPTQTAGKVHPYLYTQCQVYNVMQSFSAWVYTKSGLVVEIQGIFVTHYCVISFTTCLYVHPPSCLVRSPSMLAACYPVRILPQSRQHTLLR